MGACYSYRQFCSLGPLPPRTPARPDPQVPNDRKLGVCVHGMIGAFYFYEQGASDDAAFGFFDIELSVQQIDADTIRIEVYCVADGYQTSRGVGAKHPLRISVMAGDKIVATAEWRFADVICGHADPMHFSADAPLGSINFAEIDRIALENVEGWSAAC